MSDVLEDLVASGSQTVGPFFHFGLTDKITRRIAEASVPGEHVRVKFRVTDGAGAPVFDAMVEVWQADPGGQYPEPVAWDGKTPPPAFCGYGRQPTDANGECQFETVKPGRVADGEGGLQAPHLNICLFARGLLRQLHTRVYFDGDPTLGEDAALARVPEDRRATLLAHASESAPGLWQFDIRLQGAQETVFFDL
jgi:protocatechuate 3,4-dioxygenase alpha subunit